MKKKLLVATIGAFACATTLGVGLLFIPTNSATAKNDQTIFSDQFTTSTLDGSKWTTTGDVSMATVAGVATGPVSGLANWTTSGSVTVSGDTATINAGSYIYLPVSSDYTLTFTANRSATGATALDVDKALLIGMSVADPGTYTSGAWFAGDGSDANSNLFINGANVTTTYQNNSWCGQNGTMTLTVKDGVANLVHATHGAVYVNFPVSTSGYVSFYVPAGAGAATLSGVTYTDNVVSEGGYQVAIGTQGGSLISNTVVPGYDTRHGNDGWDGATELIFDVDLSGLGTATFTAALGDVSASVSPDGGRYVLTLWDGNEKIDLTSSNTNPAVVAGNDKFYFTVRGNGGLSVSFGGITYVGATAATASPYGSIAFSVTEGADSAIPIDNVSLKVDEWEADTSSGTATLADLTTSGDVAISGETATINAGGYIYLPVSSNYTMTFTKARGTTGATVLDEGQSLLIGINVADPVGYRAGAWFTSSSGNNSNLFIDGVNTGNGEGSYTANTWFGQDGTLTLTVADGVATLTHATHGAAYSNFPVGTAGYVSFSVPAGASAATISGFSYTDHTYVPDTSVSHVFEDENGLLYYANNQESSSTISFSSVAPKTAPEKDGYTFAGWTKAGEAVGDTVAGDADATYKPSYVLGEVEYVSVTLEGDIGLNYYLNLPSELTADEAAKVHFNVDGEEQTVNLADGQSTEYGMMYTAYVAADAYDKDVVMTIETTAGEAVTYTSSVKNYIEKILVSDDEELVKFQQTAEAMRDYGEAAQEYFAGNTTVDLANTQITADTLNDYRPITTVEGNTEGVYILGSTLVLESKTSLRYYFTTTEEIAATLTCKIDGVDAEVYKKSSATTDYYYVEIPNIAAQDLDKRFEVQIGAHSKSICALSYAYLVLSGNVADNSLVNAMRALYLYNFAAQNYFNPSAEAGATTATSYWVEDTTWNDTFDFVLNVEEGRDVKILQLTDIQIIDATQMRKSDRLHSWQQEWWAPQKMYDVAFKYMREAVEKSQPDLIVLSGDNTYGEFDDKGTTLPALIREMDSYKIPWSLTWGNHDNESYKGTAWMASQYNASEYCRMTIEDSGITGSGNYTIGVVQGGELTTAVFCVDSNGHTGITASHPAGESNYIYTAGQGVQQDQIDWISSELSAIKAANGGVAVESIGFTHHPLYGQKLGLAKYDYTNTTTGDLASPVVIESDNNAATVTAQDGDFGGFFYEPVWTDKAGVGGDTDLALHNVSKAGNLVGWFFGHIHWNSASVLYDGVRYTNGLKVGLYDDYEVGEVGGTLISIGQGNSMRVNHLYTDYDTSTRP